MGSYIELVRDDWFGKFNPQVKLHVIDSGRPHCLENLFTPGEGGNRIILWDDGGAEDLEDVKIAWEAVRVRILDLIGHKTRRLIECLVAPRGIRRRRTR